MVVHVVDNVCHPLSTYHIQASNTLLSLTI